MARNLLRRRGVRNEFIENIIDNAERSEALLRARISVGIF